MTPELKQARDNATASTPDMVRVLKEIALNDECDPNARIKAANSICDRGGLPALKEIAIDPGDPQPAFDTSGMSDADLLTFIRLVRLARGRSPTGGVGTAGDGTDIGSGAPSGSESP